MPVYSVQVNSTIIVEFWFGPCCWSWTRISWVGIFHNFIRLHERGWEHVLLSFSITIDVENIDFLPWVSWMSVDPSNELESICVLWCHCDIELSIFVASFGVQINSSPIRWIISICTECWIGETWFFRWSESSSFQCRSRDLDSSFKICIVSDSGNHSPVINGLESSSNTPAESSISQTPSGCIPARFVPCLRVASLIVSAVLPSCTSDSWESCLCIFDQQCCD